MMLDADVATIEPQSTVVAAASAHVDLTLEDRFVLRLGVHMGVVAATAVATRAQRRRPLEGDRRGPRVGGGRGEQPADGAPARQLLANGRSRARCRRRCWPAGARCRRRWTAKACSSASRFPARASSSSLSWRATGRARAGGCPRGRRPPARHQPPPPPSHGHLAARHRLVPVTYDGRVTGLGQAPPSARAVRYALLAAVCQLSLAVSASAVMLATTHTGARDRRGRGCSCDHSTAVMCPMHRRSAPRPVPPGTPRWCGAGDDSIFALLPVLGTLAVPEPVQQSLAPSATSLALAPVAERPVRLARPPDSPPPRA